MSAHKFVDLHSGCVAIRCIRGTCSASVELTNPTEAWITQGGSELIGLPFFALSITANMQRAHEEILPVNGEYDVGCRGRGKTYGGGFGAINGQSAYHGQSKRIRIRRHGIRYE